MLFLVLLVLLLCIATVATYVSGCVPVWVTGWVAVCVAKCVAVGIVHPLCVHVCSAGRLTLYIAECGDVWLTSAFLREVQSMLLYELLCELQRVLQGMVRFMSCVCSTRSTGPALYRTHGNATSPNWAGRQVRTDR